MNKLLRVLIGDDCVMEFIEDGKVIKTINNVYIGKDGATLHKKEGDHKTPFGLFKLGPAFGFNDFDIDYPYLKISDNSYFVDDVSSKYYNKWVEIGGCDVSYPYVVSGDLSDFSSAEHMSDYPILYEYGVIIEYNMDNPVRGLGSAIFLHVKNKDYTEGCVALLRDDMLSVLKFLDGSKEVYIEIKKRY